MTDFPNRIIHILRGCPNGLTSKDIAERLGTTRRNLSSRLSKLAAYGIIDRVRGTVAEHGTKGAIYRAAREEARAAGLTSWDIIQGNVRIERHDPGVDDSIVVADVDVTPKQSNAIR